MLPELTEQELSATLDTVATDALTALEPCEPPINTLVLARALGLAIAWDERQAGRGRIVRLGEFVGDGPRVDSAAPDHGRNGCNGRLPTKSASSARCRFLTAAVDPRKRRPVLARRSPTNWPVGCCCPAIGWSRRRGMWLGPGGAEAAIRDGQPRVDRPANARLRPQNRDHDLRPRSSHVSPRQPARPVAAAGAVGTSAGGRPTRQGETVPSGPR